MVAARHVVLVNSIRRPGVHPLYTEREGGAGRTIAEELSGHLRWDGLRHLKNELRADGVPAQRQFREDHQIAAFLRRVAGQLLDRRQVRP